MCSVATTGGNPFSQHGRQLPFLEGVVDAYKTDSRASEVVTKPLKCRPHLPICSFRSQLKEVNARGDVSDRSGLMSE